MRLSKIQVVTFTLACLLISGPAQAQFGKLKSLAKDKLGMQPKGDTNTANQAATMAKGPAGEAKATFAPGVTKGKSLDVQRQNGPSSEAKGKSTQGGAAPEASIAAIDGGRVQDVSIKLAHADARQLDAVRGYRPCNKLTNFKILSPTQMKVTLDLSGNTSGGTCPLYFVSGGNTVFTSNVQFRAKK